MSGQENVGFEPEDLDAWLKFEDRRREIYDHASRRQVILFIEEDSTALTRPLELNVFTNCTALPGRVCETIDVRLDTRVLDELTGISDCGADPDLKKY